MTGEGRWVGMGDQQEATPHRLEQATTRLEREQATAVKSQAHLWLVLLTHKASDAMLDAFADPDPANVPILDLDTLMGQPAVVCYVCEQPFTQRDRLRRCPGERSQ